MEIQEVSHVNESLIQELSQIWEKSVRATHLFLTEADIQKISSYLPDAFRSVSHLAIAKLEQKTIGFVGVENNRIEMLFLLPEEQGKGFGKQLLNYAIHQYHATKLYVNEQNPNAKDFYEHMGFQVYKRTEKDEQGDPFPLLYMELNNKEVVS
ncbi:GNAT family N-acetyltransferase [Massilioclostridium coli]|uniref:GNAT family N-acetyltransferase n=1 Tax=Massilioclostridium coli TaxID=1870991 RepID=UPI00085BDCA3|nr:GNAT family N-acetyltransferase [Massilioclostridium coli]